MKTKSTKVFKEFDVDGQMLRRRKRVRAIVVVSIPLLCLFPTAVFAHTVTNYFGLEMPLIYVQAGLEVNPVGPGGMPGPGVHPFPVDLGAFWDPNMLPPPPPAVPPPGLPPELIDRGPGSGARFRGASAHVIAPHPGEVAPAPTWSYDISVADPPGPFGAVETRIRGSEPHGHPDHYMAVVGVLSGTAPGAPVGPRRVIIGGSIGRHTRPYPGLPNKEPIYGGGELEPPSGLPSPGDLDYPMAELLTIVDTEDTPNPHFSLMAIIDGLQADMINNVFLRQGPNGPILMDLLPLMQTQQLGQYGSLLTIADAAMPQHIVQTIGSEDAYVSVEFPTTIHPDGAIVGAVSLVPKTPLVGDYNGDDVVDTADYPVLRKTFGLSGNDLPADGDGNGRVDIRDLALWRTNFGQNASISYGLNHHDHLHFENVPEPAGAFLLVIGAVPAIWKRRRVASPTLN